MGNTLYHLYQPQASVEGYLGPLLVDWKGGGQVAATVNSDLRLEVFYIADDNQIYHSWQDVPGIGKPFVITGTVLFPGTFAKQIAVANNADGRIEVFYIDTNDRIGHMWEGLPGGGPWTNKLLGGTASQLALAHQQDQRLMLISADLDGSLSISTQNSLSPGTPPDDILWTTSALRGKAKRMTIAANHDGRLELIYIGMDNGLYHNWQLAPNSTDWGGGVSGAQAAGLGGYGRELTSVTNTDGRIEFFYIGTNNAIYHNWQKLNDPDGDWSGEALFGGQAQQLALCQQGDGRLELFYVGMDGRTWHNWQTSLNGSWNGAIIGTFASYISAVTDRYGCINLFVTGDAQANVGAVPAPSDGLGSYSNYLIVNSCRFLEKVAVHIKITEDIVVESNGAPEAGMNSLSGFTCQVNCYSPAAKLSTWQQYSILFDGSSFKGWVNNWKDLDTFLVNRQFDLGSIQDGKVPTGYTLSIALSTDLDGNVVGAVFQVSDDKNKSIGSATATLATLPNVTAADIAPIVSFELNIVGPGNKESVLFSSGAGTISYTAATALLPLSANPTCAISRLFTAETSNIIYDTLTATPSTSLVQSFHIDSTMTAPPKPSGTRPPLRQ